jgi:glycosidase
MTALDGDARRAKLAATLLLTLPGLPFVYYGEEIGMTGDKPDERIRTPMPWDATRNAGFTTGTPWETLQPDWTTTNVDAERMDSTSLLARYRKLIHLRAAKAALGSGDFVALETGDTRVAGYLRRGGGRAVLVVVNLDTTAHDGITLSSAQTVLSPGGYRATELLGVAATGPVSIGANGRLDRYVPFPTLSPLEAYVLELSRIR